MAKSYEASGVSLEAGYESVRRIKKHISRTERLGMMGNIGSFGGMFDLSALQMKEPILVSGTDGVGTKLKLAFLMDKHDTIGQDVVAMCVNDVLAQGAQPLFFLDYVAVGKNDPAKIEQIVKNSLEKIKEKRNFVSEENLQNTLHGFGVIRRLSSKFKIIRFEAKADDLFEKNTNEIERNSISLSSLNKEGAIFYDDNSLKLSEENEIKIIQDIEKEFDEGSSHLNTACKNKIDNSFNFKNPLNLILVSHKPEREFVKNLIKEENAKSIDAWIKSRDTGFYTIEYSWREGEHPKNGKFNPDFVIKIGKNILIIETKINTDVTDENKGKVEYTKKHVTMLNSIQNKQKYYFWMISPEDYDNFFRKLREGRWGDFISTLEINLECI